MTEPPFEPDDGGIYEARLGDLLGDDEKLRSNISGLEEKINIDSTNKNKIHLFNILHLSKHAIPQSWSAVKTAVEWGLDRFTGHEIRLIKAKGDAESKMILSKAQAELLKAQAEKTRAEAEKTRAEANKIDSESDVAVMESIAKVETELQMLTERQRLLKRLHAKGINLMAQYEDGVLKVAVVKDDKSNAV